MDAADRLTRDAQPDVFLAEPVGSCTDLRATVSIRCGGSTATTFASRR